MIKYLFSKRLQNVVDVKAEDTSEESKRNHVLYYKSLTKIISDIQKEKNQEAEPAIKNHLDSRVEAMEKDRERIRVMFPDIKEEEWNGDTD
jgi:uncharacterized protein YicC (UPF0701 family)